MLKPSARITSFLLLIKFLKLFDPKKNIHRFEEGIKSYLNFVNRPPSNSLNEISNFIYPGITHKPWYDFRDHHVLKSVCDTLEKGFSDIEAEWLAYSKSGYKIAPRINLSVFGESLKNQDDDWKYYLIWRHGKFTEAALTLFPKTTKIVSSLDYFLYSLGEVVLIVMESGVVLPPHTDHINTSLTCHLGVKIPDNCGIRVDGETRCWIRGKTLFFDDSFQHEAWNKSKEVRVVLSLDLYHPELKKVEKFLLNFLLKHFNLTSDEGGYNNTQDSQSLQKLLANLSTSEHQTR